MTQHTINEKGDQIAHEATNQSPRIPKMGQNVTLPGIAAELQKENVRESSLSHSVQSGGGQAGEPVGNWAVRLGNTEAKRFAVWGEALAYFEEFAAEGWVPCGLNIFDRANGFEMWPAKSSEGAR
jgi:hypothetical protein